MHLINQLEKNYYAQKLLCLSFLVFACFALALFVSILDLSGTTWRWVTTTSSSWTGTTSTGTDCSTTSRPRKPSVRPVGAHAANLGQYQCEGVGLVSVDGLVYIRGVN